ncbi:MAG: photosynthetic complex putative assembly protein PuhB [Pseudomonadota bacterium]
MSAPGSVQIRGIHDPLPEGERVLWQGAPDWRSLAVRAFHVRKVAVYFAVLVAWKLAGDVYDGAAVGTALTGSLWLALVGLSAVGLLMLLAWLSGRTSIYAITNRRVFLRIGIALPIFVNLPFSGIEAAAVKDGAAGDIPLRLKPGVRLAYLHLWPHARAWHLKRPEPTLRSVPDALAVARILAQALAEAAGVPVQWKPAAESRAPADAITTASASSWGMRATSSR